jgi:hypothetical protein
MNWSWGTWYRGVSPMARAHNPILELDVFKAGSQISALNFGNSCVAAKRKEVAKPYSNPWSSCFNASGLEARAKTGLLTKKRPCRRVHMRTAPARSWWPVPAEFACDLNEGPGVDQCAGCDAMKPHCPCRKARAVCV